MKKFLYGIQKDDRKGCTSRFGSVEGSNHNDALQKIIDKEYNYLVKEWYVSQLTTVEEANNL